MDPDNEQAGGSDLKEWPALESSVIRALCLTVNVAGSIVKDNILDTLTKDHFSLPINRGLFSALKELHHRGEYVVLSNLEDELHDLALDIPGDLSLEDLFRGDPPKAAEVKKWVERLRERTTRGESAAPAGPPERQPAAPTISQAAPAASAGAEAPPAPAGRPAESQAPGRGSSLTRIRPAPEARRRGPEPERQAKAGPEAAERKPRPAGPAVLSSEGDEWATYLQAVVAQQGRILETGFAGLDEAAGGLSPGLMLVFDQDPGRSGDFLKQLADQVAARSKVPCLFVSRGLSKAELRVRTLSRLSGVPAKDIGKGRIKKGSAEWESVEQQGRAAAEWLRWIFIADAESEMDLGQVRDTGRQLLESKSATTCLVVVDALDKIAGPGEPLQKVVAGLVEVSEALDVLVIAATANKALLSEPGVDFLATLGEGRGGVELEVTRAEDSRPILVRFEYRPDIHRFTEQPGS
jgi:replicative DNA helicase